VTGALGYPAPGYSPAVALRPRIRAARFVRVEHAVGGARDASRAAVEDVGVDHRGAHVLVTEQLLNGADVAPVLEQMGGEGMTEAVRGGPLGEASLRHGRQDGHAVLGALGVADDDLVHPEVEVLDSQAAAFEQSQPRAIQEGGREAARAVQYGDDRADLITGQDDGEAFRAPDPDDVVEPGQVLVQDVAVEEEERAERLVLVEAATLPWTARELRNRVTSGAPISAGWR